MKPRTNRATRWALFVMMIALLPSVSTAQFTSGSDGSDGPFAPTADVVVDLAEKQDGIYQYASVNIPAGVTVTFTPNANNTPVKWLVQTTAVIDGTININGASATGGNGPGVAGPGGFPGGPGALAFPGGLAPGPGGGPGGAGVDSNISAYGGSAAYGNNAARNESFVIHPDGEKYGNQFILPLIGGSGGGGGTSTDTNAGGAGGGGGGAILIAASENITLAGTITANGGNGYNVAASSGNDGGGGSGGAIRLLAPLIDMTATSVVSAAGGDNPRWSSMNGGPGRIRFDGTIVNFETGSTRNGAASTVSIGIVMLPEGVGPRLTITTVGGVPVTLPTSGNFDPLVPNVTVAPETTNPVNVVVASENVPDGTTVDVVMRPKVGDDTSTAGTITGNAATVPVDLQPGDGTLHAQATIEVKSTDMAKAGLAPNGETFSRVELETTLGGDTLLAYVTPSGKRFTLPTR